MAWLKSASNHCMPGMSGCLMAEDVNAWPKSLPNEIQSALRRTRVQASLKGCTREIFISLSRFRDLHNSKKALP